MFKQQFSDRLQSYDLDHSFAPVIDIELVDSLLSKMSKGKAAGIDKLTCEHIQNSHPIVTSTITKLFNLMLLHNYVPNDFGCGIIIPIPKDKENRRQDKLEDYRGIKISPVLSKLFEQCLLHFLKYYLINSER